MLIISFIATKFLNPCSTAFLQKLQSDCLSDQSVIPVHWFNTGITFVLKRNIISRKFIKFSMSMHISTLCPYYYKILKKTELTKWLITIWKTTKYLYHEISCNIFFNTISFKPHSWYLNGFNKEHTSMLLVSTLFRRKTMCIFTYNTRL